ncbi:16S rRNA pseudouridine(516) synthase [Vibrio sp. UCD-FRSSP16_10]|uniref:pseudouridine synthase n=1 Tax=unclassified Vibrio TaxID=2614977 RepID=UPI0007FF1651|nr:MULTISPECIES: pseudouridine synthase [unclassified Vibrio]OBT09439.1 16S rRNA pseudouridine(516) synthase [Vibrio sp. UCD-FRSSP16_30]OBT22118.1 16S rRNA pseudouridine(516) synthase [Vibrio sp. UCD-FRSSP16_10]
MRLDKFVCKSTQLTKLEAIAHIHSGKVRVNGNVEIGESTQVHENNTVCLNDDELIARPFRYILLHKPAGTICSNIDEAYPSLFNYLQMENVSELHIAGRLDADTTGMVLITDDGRWSFNITRPISHCKKVYQVTLSKEITDDVAIQFKNGIKMQGENKLTLPASLVVINSKEVLLTITEGKFHQVKRMFSAVGNRVVSLHRVAIGAVSLDIEVGQWRYLTELEINSFIK